MVFDPFTVVGLILCVIVVAYACLAIFGDNAPPPSAGACECHR